jgi:NTP pyrophosphatase (non-canonical NTP hydrolase)
MVVTRKSLEGNVEAAPLEEQPVALVKALFEGWGIMKLAKELNLVAHSKGWWIHTRTFGDIIALIHSELSEAFEEHREGFKATEVRAGDKTYGDPDGQDWFELETLASHGVEPTGIGIELADALIRILDYAQEAEIDLDQLVRIKTEFNRTRSYRHGNKVV